MRLKILDGMRLRGRGSFVGTDSSAKRVKPKSKSS